MRRKRKERKGKGGGQGNGEGRGGDRQEEREDREWKGREERGDWWRGTGLCCLAWVLQGLPDAFTVTCSIIQGGG